MFRLLGHMLPDNKSIGIALTYIYGIWMPRSKEICTQVVLGENKKLKKMTKEEREQVIAFFNK